MGFAADRRAIRSLRVGVVPSSHVLHLTVGADPINRILDSEIDRALHGKQKPIAIVGEWGTGKSNMLSYMREYALQRNIAVAYVNLNGRSAAANHPQRYYHKIVGDIRLPGIPGKGIVSLLKKAIKSNPLARETVAWASSNKDDSEFAWGLHLFAERRFYPALEIILGSDLSWADYNYKKLKAVKRLGDLGTYLKAVGFKGFMVQFDELETIIQLWNCVSRRGAYRFMYRISNLKDVWPVFATTERLHSQMIYDRTVGNLKEEAARSFVLNYFSLQKIEPPHLDKRRADDLLGRIYRLYTRVYRLPTEVDFKKVIERWDNMPLKNHRRLIRIAIDHLDCRRPIAENMCLFPINLGAEGGLPQEPSVMSIL